MKQILIEIITICRHTRVIILKKINRIKNTILHFHATLMITCKRSMTFRIHMQKEKINTYPTKIYLIQNMTVNNKIKTKTYIKSLIKKSMVMKDLINLQKKHNWRTYWKSLDQMKFCHNLKCGKTWHWLNSNHPNSTDCSRKNPRSFLRAILS